MGLWESEMGIYKKGLEISKPFYFGFLGELNKSS